MCFWPCCKKKGFVYITGLPASESITTRKLRKSNGASVADYAHGATFNTARQGVAVDRSGNYYIAGSPAGGVTLRKFNSSNSEQWNYSHGNTLDAVAVNSTHVAVCGSRSSDGTTVRLLDHSGNLVWSESTFYPATGVDIDADGNVYVCCDTSPVVTRIQGGGGGLNEIQSISMSGNPATGGTFGLSMPPFLGFGAGSVFAYNVTAAEVQSSIRASNGGNPVVTCSGGPFPDDEIFIEFTGSYSNMSIPLVLPDGMLLTGIKTVFKLDENGDEVWSSSGFPGLTQAIAVDQSGNVAVVGRSFAPFASRKNLRYFSSDGTELWSTNVADPSEFIRHPVAAVAFDVDGNVYAGAFAGSNADRNLVKYSSSGEEIWSRFVTAGTRCVAVDRQGFVYAAGQPVLKLKQLEDTTEVVWSFTHGASIGGIDCDPGRVGAFA